MSRACRRHHSQQIRNCGNTGFPVLIAGADLPGTPQAEPVGIKGAAQCHSAGVRQAAKVFVVAGRGQRGAEKNRRTPFRKVHRQKGAGVKAEHRGTHLTAAGGYLQHEVVIEGIRHPQPCADVKI